MGERGHPVTAPGLLAGCILEAAAHPGEGGGTDHTLHGRARRHGRSPRVAQPSRSTSTQRAPPALTAAVSAPPPCRSPREFVRRRPRLHPGLATGAPGRRRRRRPSGREGSVSGGSGTPRAPRLSCRGGTALAPSEGVVSRETRSSAMPSVSACLFTPIFRATLTHDETRRGTAPSGGLTSSSAAPPGDHRSGPPGRQPFTAGAPRPAISAAASRYATAPAEAGS